MPLKKKYYYFCTHNQILTIMKKSFLYFAATMLLTSCSSDLLIEEPISVSNKKSSTSLTLEEAIERGNKVFDEIFKNDPAVRSCNRVISNVEYITSNTVKTRGETSDTLFYVVNFTEDKGFMMLSADSRLNPVYALSDEGTLDFTDTTFNYGLKSFYDITYTGALNILAGHESPDDFILPPQEPGLPLSIGPLLSEVQEKIHQDSPYNKYCPVTMGITSLVGCPAVAMEQVLSYHKYPYYLLGTAMKWDDVNDGTNISQLQISLYRIGVQIGTQYHVDPYTGYRSSGVNDSTAFINGFRSFDYEPGRFRPLQSPVAATGIKLYGPLLMICKKLYTDDSQNSFGHAWVIDGYKRTSDYSYGGSTYYLHCVWGQYGRSGNGYYLWENKKFVQQDGSNVYEPKDGVYMLYGTKPLYNQEPIF